MQATIWGLGGGREDGEGRLSGFRPESSRHHGEPAEPQGQPSPKRRELSWPITCKFDFHIFDTCTFAYMQSGIYVLILNGSFSAVSKPMFAIEYSLESS